MLSHTAYVDESIRGPSDYLAVAVVPATHQANLDRLMRSLCLPGQRRVHLKAESDSRRRLIIGSLAGSALVRAWIYRARRPVLSARDRCLQGHVADLVLAGIGRLLLDHVDERQVTRDRLSIETGLRKVSADLRYDHAESREYAGLQAADVLAWAYGAGGDWRRRISPVLEQIKEVDP